MRSLLRHRDARLFLFGQTVSMFGDRALYLALGIWVKQLTGSNAAAGMVFFLLVVPTLVAPLAGVVVDRVRRRPLMIVADVVVACSVLALVFVHGRDDIWLIYAVTLIYGLSAVLFGSAQSALLTVMLPRDLLADANGLLQTGSEAMRLVAPLGRLPPATAGARATAGAARAPLPAPGLGGGRAHRAHPRAAAHGRRDGGLPARRRVLRDADLRGRRQRPAPRPLVPRRAALDAR
jgi:MFS family permease